jgi:hypothetical protein
MICFLGSTSVVTQREAASEASPCLLLIVSSLVIPCMCHGHKPALPYFVPYLFIVQGQQSPKLLLCLSPADLSLQPHFNKTHPPTHSMGPPVPLQDFGASYGC